jgi:hypothetical protein
MRGVSLHSVSLQLLDDLPVRNQRRLIVPIIHLKPFAVRQDALRTKN